MKRAKTPVAAPTTAISSLRLRVPGTSAQGGRRLAQAVADRLAAQAGELQPGDGQTLRIRVQASSSPSSNALAEAIARAIANARRTTRSGRHG
jgi:hypothetical protein